MWLCVCVCSQGAEAEWGRAVFPQHSTNAGVVWSGAACRHGRVISSIKLSRSIIFYGLISFHAWYSLSFSQFLFLRTPTMPLWWWVWPPVVLQYSVIWFAPVSSPGECWCHLLQSIRASHDSKFCRLNSKIRLFVALIKFNSKLNLYISHTTLMFYGCNSCFNAFPHHPRCKSIRLPHSHRK